MMSTQQSYFRGATTIPELIIPGGQIDLRIISTSSKKSKEQKI